MTLSVGKFWGGTFASLGTALNGCLPEPSGFKIFAVSDFYERTLRPLLPLPLFSVLRVSFVLVSLLAETDKTFRRNSDFGVDFEGKALIW